MDRRIKLENVISKPLFPEMIPDLIDSVASLHEGPGSSVPACTIPGVEYAFCHHCH